MPDHCTQLARILAEIDQLLATTEEFAEQPDCERYRDRVLGWLIEFREIRYKVEVELKGE